ncbi:hypothetical protein OSTOST_02636, partial [Ostertagia ostertagi]
LKIIPDTLALVAGCWLRARARCWLCKASRLRVVNVAATGRRILECANRNCLATIEYTDLPEGTIIEQEKATKEELMDGICEILQKWYIPPKKGWKRSRIHRLNMCARICSDCWTAGVLSVRFRQLQLVLYVMMGPECPRRDLPARILRKLGSLMKSLYTDLDCRFRNFLFSCSACEVFLIFLVHRAL